MILAKYYWSLILTDGLIALTEPTLVSFEVDKGLLALFKGSVNGFFSLLFVEASFVHDGMHVNVVADWRRSLFVYHFPHFSSLSPGLLLLLIARRDLLFLLWLLEIWS